MRDYKQFWIRIHHHVHTYVWRKGLAVTSAEGRAEGLAHGEGRVPALPLGHHGRDGLFLKPRSGPWPGVT